MTVSRRIWLCIAALALTAPSASLAASKTAEFERYLHGAMREWGVPGVAVVLAKDHKIVMVKGFGVRALDGREPVDEHTVFAIASVTKPFTAAALAMLVDEGKVRWDDPLKKFMPDLALYDAHVAEMITLRDVLAHRTCLEDRNLLTWNSPFGADEVFRRLRHVKPACTFRDRFEYGNLNFMLAGNVVAAVSGRSWQEFVEERIFEPLGMRSSTASTAVARRAGNLATPYIKVGGSLKALPLFDEGPTAAAGSIHSSAADMAKWLEVQLGAGRMHGKTLWSTETSQEMHEPQMTVRRGTTHSLLMPHAEYMSYGLGWFVHDFHHRKIVEHDGQSDGMHALASMMPETGVGIVVLTNTSMLGLPQSLAYRWYELNLGVPMRDWSAEFLRKLRPINDSIDLAAITRDMPRVPDTRPSLASHAYTGKYHNDLLGEATVAQDTNGELLISLLGRSGRMQHWHHDTFRLDWQGEVYLALAVPFATFALDSAGEAKAIEFSSDSFTRVPEAKLGATVRRELEASSGELP